MFEVTLFTPSRSIDLLLRDLGTTEILTLKEMSITVEKKLNNSVVSSSRNAAVHIYFNLKYVVTC